MGCKDVVNLKGVKENSWGMNVRKIYCMDLLKNCKNILKIIIIYILGIYIKFYESCLFLLFY